MAPAVVTTVESSHLLPVLAHAIACAGSQRALLIKGTAATRHGLRQPRVSADVDVLVEPVNFELAVQAFENAGWEIKGGRPPIQPRELVGVTLVHPLWPQPIDLHRRFVGFTNSAKEVFEALWADRSATLLAGVEVAIAGAASSCLIQGLHALRDPQWDWNHEFDQAVTWLRDADETVRDQVVRLAGTTGAGETAAPLLAAAGLHSDPTLAGGQVEFTREFRRRAERRGNPTAGYLEVLLDQPLRKWPRLFVRFAFGSEESLRIWYYRSEDQALPLWRLRLRRLRDAIKQLPSALRSLWRARHRRSNP